MTEEQIKQNAEIYARYSSRSRNTAYYAYIEGAHSRDGEIEELKEQLESCKQTITKFTKIINKYGKELNQLKHPWISVEERLPEKVRVRPKDNSLVILAYDGDDFYLTAEYNRFSWITELYFPIEPKKWAYIPDECIELSKSIITK